jgi:uncharacterized protein involved in tolerance to divalent cations
MVNIVIYLKQEFDAMELVKSLLTEKLVASASIDINNASYKMENNKLVGEIFSVITAQSKALLFADIVKHVENKLGEEIPIISMPIIGSNRIFDTTIKTKTHSV